MSNDDPTTNVLLADLLNRVEALEEWSKTVHDLLESVGKIHQEMLGLAIELAEAVTKLQAKPS
jgi:hypothetical protein